MGTVGPAPPTTGQLAHLRKLCALTGQHYSRPTTRKQAAGRIRDLEIRRDNARQAKRARPKPPAPPREQPRPPRDDFMQALRRLKRAAYDDAPLDLIHRLERAVDVALEARHGS